ncbi:MAG: hypothetical protein EWM73_01938 [Nitrospira sp.]|nr:MAG: hypothetical protein EWM73_01938 [Nitrospira sp.]
MPKFLADLAIGLLKNLQHRGPGCLIGFPVEFHGKVCDVPAGEPRFALFGSADFGRDGAQIGLHGGVIARAGGGLIEMENRFAELIPFLKEIGQRQMGEGLVWSQGDQLLQIVLRHGWIAQFPEGMGEVEMNGRVMGVQRRCLLEGIYRGCGAADFLELNAEIIP